MGRKAEATSDAADKASPFGPDSRRQLIPSFPQKTTAAFLEREGRCRFCSFKAQQAASKGAPRESLRNLQGLFR
jgi:hypothetical protein